MLSLRLLNTSKAPVCGAGHESRVAESTALIGHTGRVCPPRYIFDIIGGPYGAAIRSSGCADAGAITSAPDIFHLTVRPPLPDYVPSLTFHSHMRKLLNAAPSRPAMPELTTRKGSCMSQSLLSIGARFANPIMPC